MKTMTAYESATAERLRRRKDRALTFLHRHILLKELMRENREEFDTELLGKSKRECYAAVADFLGAAKKTTFSPREELSVKKAVRIIQESSSRAFK